MKYQEEQDEAISVIDDSKVAELFDNAFGKIDTIKTEPAIAPDPEEAFVEEQPKEAEEERVEGAEESEAIVEESKKDKLWDIKRERFQALKDREQLEEENRNLKEALKKSWEVGDYHYGKNVFSDLEKAKNDLKKAFEIGDSDAWIEANRNLIRIETTIHELEKWERQKAEPSPEPKAQQQSEYERAITEDLIGDWLDKHPYLQQGSKQYNAELADKVIPYVDALDAYLVKTNRQNAYLSDEYFNNIENYMSGLTKPKIQVEPQPINTSVGRVRGSAPSGATTRTAPMKVTLTAEDKDWAQRFNVTEEAYLRSKIEDMERAKQNEKKK